MNTCESCCYWSEMIAKSQNGVIVALCLCPRGSMRQEWTTGQQTCEAYSKGDPVDAPPKYLVKTASWTGQRMYTCTGCGRSDFLSEHQAAHHAHDCKGPVR